MFENLSERLERSFKILKGEGKITEINVAETLKDVRRALLDADVNYKVAKQFTDTVKAKAMGQNVLTAVKPGQMMVKIVHDELATLMGGDTADVNLNGQPAIILMSGLQGSGKTTFSGKLAKMFKSKRAKRPLLVACDVYRPAAIDQLKVLGEQIEVPVYSEEGVKDPVAIAKNGVKYARENGFDLVIVDTAGRLAIDEQMMKEIAAIKAAINPGETLFVVDSMTGQDAVNTAKEFNDRLDFDGVVLTKLDGDTRGGAALSIRTVVNKPIKFIGTGEKLDAVDYFHPSRMADRILGMGDIVSLVERAQEQYDEEEYVVETRKRDTFFMVFNTVYNDIHAFTKEPENGIFTGYLNKEFTDNKARDEFLEFMHKEFPNTKLIEVFDLVNSSYMTYPYLGSIAIDCEENDDVYNAICKKYEDSEGMALSNNAVFWVITYDLALEFYKERKEAWESELE